MSKGHAAWAFSRGGVEFGRAHYPAMVALHTGLLAGAVAEVWLLDRPFVPALGWLMLALVVASQALRWWCIATLGQQWNTRVIVVPGLALVSRGPYRWLRHPNYVAVAVEGLALPLVHSAWLTAAVFTVLNAALLHRPGPRRGAGPGHGRGPHRCRACDGAGTSMRQVAVTGTARDVVVVGGARWALRPRCMPCGRDCPSSSSSRARAWWTRPAARGSCQGDSRRCSGWGSRRSAATWRGSGTWQERAWRRPTSPTAQAAGAPHRVARTASRGTGGGRGRGAAAGRSRCRADR